MEKLDNDASISINGVFYTPSNISESLKSLSETNHLFLIEVLLFLQEWWNEEESIKVQTSGSTGQPKQIMLSKKAMRESAKRTLSILGIKKGETALLCMNIKYIGAKMMVVRSLIGGLNLVLSPPSRSPFQGLSSDQIVDFVALVPLQVYELLRNPQEQKRVRRIKHVIIGGGVIHPLIEEEIAGLPNEWYATYGMTETISHIALRRLNGRQKSSRYYPLEGVSVSLSRERTLLIKAPHLFEGILQTNDVAELDTNGGFEILGRVDNIINSGGIKVSPEQIEKRLSKILDCRFALSSLVSVSLGEELVLVLERELTKEEKVQIKEALTPYERPKKIILLEHIPLTQTAKVARDVLRKMIAQSPYSLFKL